MHFGRKKYKTITLDARGIRQKKLRGELFFCVFVFHPGSFIDANRQTLQLDNNAHYNEVGNREST